MMTYAMLHISGPNGVGCSDDVLLSIAPAWPSIGLGSTGICFFVLSLNNSSV